MKILVIDDTQKHLDSAIQTLEGHDVTTCATYDEAAKLVNAGGWDVVLSDLLMPAGKRSQGEGMKYVGQEMPVGWSLALEAVQAGAKYVAVVTDMNHHSHPASAMLDSISGTIFDINGSKVLMTNRIESVGIKDGTHQVCATCNGTGDFPGDAKYGCGDCGGDGFKFQQSGKDWAEIFDRLLSGRTYPKGSRGCRG